MLLHILHSEETCMCAVISWPGSRNVRTMSGTTTNEKRDTQVHVHSALQRLLLPPSSFSSFLLFLFYLRTDLIHESAGLEQIKERLNSLNLNLMRKMLAQEDIQKTVEKSLNVIPLNNYRSPLDSLLDSL